MGDCLLLTRRSVRCSSPTRGHGFQPRTLRHAHMTPPFQKMGCILSRNGTSRLNTAPQRNGKKTIVVVRVNPLLFDSVPRRSVSLPVPLPPLQEGKLHLHGQEGVNEQYWNQHLLKVEDRRSLSKSPLLTTHTSKSSSSPGFVGLTH